MEKSEKSTVLVCVTDQLSCGRLILAGVQIAQEHNAKVQVLSVLPEGIISENTATVMQDLFEIAGDADAEMNFYFNDSPALTAAVHARKNGATHIISGVPGVGSNLFIETLKGLLPEVSLTLVNNENEIYTFPAVSSDFMSKACAI